MGWEVNPLEMLLMSGKKLCHGMGFRLGRVSSKPVPRQGLHPALWEHGTSEPRRGLCASWSVSQPGQCHT